MPKSRERGWKGDNELMEVAGKLLFKGVLPTRDGENEEEDPERALVRSAQVSRERQESVGKLDHASIEDRGPDQSIRRETT